LENGPHQRRWPRIAVVGAGAVGCYFGGLLSRAGAPVVLIGRPAFVKAVRDADLLIETAQFQARVPVEASSEISAVRSADVVLFCVKTTGNAVAKELAPLLSSHAVVVSLQNGVDNVQQIRALAGIDALAAAVYVAASIPEPGHVKHVARGDLIVGPADDRATKVADLFLQAQISCQVSDNIEGELWTKLISNCALNAISALGQAKYGRIVEELGARQLVAGVVEEVFAVARGAHVRFPALEDSQTAIAAALAIAAQMAEATSSTAQDIARGRRTEIDALNGYIARRGAELGVETPLNHALFTLVRLLEGNFASPGSVL
jgi:2-dehydropantoate 2-reductase